MAFFSSVFQKLTDPGYSDRQQCNDTGYKLECDGEVDDFMLFTKSDDHSQNPHAMPPPQYSQVMAKNNPHSGGVVAGGTASFSGPYPDFESNRTTGSQHTHNPKICALDGVPFELWTGHMTPGKSFLLQQEIDSILLICSEICDAAYINSRYNYSFDSERSVLQELNPECSHDLSYSPDIYLPCNGSSEPSNLVDFNTDEKEPEQPPVAILVDLS